mmetsp:Transcript_57487/g.153196  ORF Transcript_57487/g.153196 Transcript_57487/m.153196 type:complete len:98 (+) Transcript_57487:39-332(+)
MRASGELTAKMLVQRASERHGVRLDVRKVSDEVDSAWAVNRNTGSRGRVRCGRVWRGQRKEEMPYRSDSLPVFVSKGKGQIGNALSPFCVNVPLDWT